MTRYNEGSSSDKVEERSLETPNAMEEHAEVSDKWMISDAPDPFGTKKRQVENCMHASSAMLDPAGLLHVPERSSSSHPSIDSKAEVPVLLEEKEVFKRRHIPLKVQKLPLWVRVILFLSMCAVVAHGAANETCEIGKDFECPDVSNKEINVEYGTSALIAIIPNGGRIDHKVTLTLYESTDNGLVPYYCCVYPWLNSTCTGCPRLLFKTKGNDMNVILVDVGRGTTFNLTAEGINSFHKFYGAVLVESITSDEEAPVITCSDNITVKTSTGESSAIADWKNPFAQDNSGQVTVMTDLLPGGSFPIGIHKVSGTAVDGSANVAQCTFFVIVQDLEPPVLSCPSDIIAEFTSDPVTWKATAVDNSGAITSVTSIPSASDLVRGINNVTVTAVDPSGNRAECVFTVNLTDEEAPVITCSDNITVETSFGKSSAIAHWIDPSALDNSGQVTVMTDLLPGDSFPIGIHKVTGTAVDGSGNVAQCTFFVIVQDLEPPVLSCPSDIIAELTSDSVTWKATAVDNSGAITSVTSIPSASDLVRGINNVTVTAVDPSGNRAECVFTVNLTAPSSDDEDDEVLLGFLWLFSLIGVFSVICFVIWGVHLCIKKKACKKNKKYHLANAKATNDKNGSDTQLHSVKTSCL